MIYATTIGTSGATYPNISPTAFLVDRCEHIYLTGWGGVTSSGTGSPNKGNTSNMPTTPDAYQPNTDGSDFYMIVLDRDAQNLLYGSYFGVQTLLTETMLMGAPVDLIRRESFIMQFVQVVEVHKLFLLNRVG